MFVNPLTYTLTAYALIAIGTAINLLADTLSPWLTSAFSGSGLLILIVLFFTTRR